MLYDRKCENPECQHAETDCYEHFSHPPVVECPKCGGMTLSRVLCCPSRIDFRGAGQFNSWLDKQRSICNDPATGWGNVSVDNH